MMPWACAVLSAAAVWSVEESLPPPPQADKTATEPNKDDNKARRYGVLRFINFPTTT
jgi:hypothetical protein